MAFAIPQQALAHRQHHSHNGNNIKVDQQTNQANVCTGTAPENEAAENPTLAENEGAETASAPTVCVNSGSNTADIHG